MSDRKLTARGNLDAVTRSQGEQDRTERKIQIGER